MLRSIDGRFRFVKQKMLGRAACDVPVGSATGNGNTLASILFPGRYSWKCILHTYGPCTAIPLHCITWLHSSLKVL